MARYVPVPYPLSTSVAGHRPKRPSYEFLDPTKYPQRSALVWPSPSPPGDLCVTSHLTNSCEVPSSRRISPTGRLITISLSDQSSIDPLLSGFNLRIFSLPCLSPPPLPPSVSAGRALSFVLFFHSLPLEGLRSAPSCSSAVPVPPCRRHRHCCFSSRPRNGGAALCPLSFATRSHL